MEIKKLNEDQINKFFVEYTKNKLMCKDWRNCQTFFNTLFELHPSLADSIRGSEYDPFYNDKNIGKLIKFIF